MSDAEFEQYVCAMNKHYSKASTRQFIDFQRYTKSANHKEASFRTKIRSHSALKSSNNI